MRTGKKPRTVYSTDKGRVCPKCGWPEKSCRCSSQMDEAVPDRITARLRIEKAGRKGKTVTVVESLPRNPAFLKDLAGELKRTCGSGVLWRADTENLLAVQAEGLGSMVRSEAPDDWQARASHEDGFWRLDLRLPGWFTLNASGRVAAAIWRGAAKERAGLKSVTPGWLEVG